LSALKGKINQNEVNYAKRTQFLKKSNVYKLNKNNELQRKMQIGHLVKTNPNKANSCPERSRGIYQNNLRLRQTQPANDKRRETSD
jgi:hypothetical protein